MHFRMRGKSHVRVTHQCYDSSCAASRSRELLVRVILGCTSHSRNAEELDVERDGFCWMICGDGGQLYCSVVLPPCSDV